MCSDVCSQCALHSKGSETLITLVWLFMRMDANMADKVTWFLELFCAEYTLMPLYPTNLKTYE